MRPLWVDRQIANLLAQWLHPTGNEAWIGVRDSLPFAGARRAPMRLDGRLEIAPDLALADGFIWRPNDARSQAELWLDPGYGSYRRAFERFAVRELGAVGLDDADVQIDHLFPKSSALRNDFGYVRMLAVPPAGNMAAGRTIEKAMARRNDAYGPGDRSTRMATYFAIGKASGFAGYEALPDGEEAGNAAMVAALFAHLRQFGLPPEVLTALDARLTAFTATRIR